MIYSSLQLQQMVEPLIALGILWLLVGRKHPLQFHCDADGVDHNILCGAGVYIPPLDMDPNIRRIKILILQLPQRTAVYRIGEVRPKALYIEMIRPPPEMCIRDSYWTYKYSSI